MKLVIGMIGMGVSVGLASMFMAYLINDLHFNQWVVITAGVLVLWKLLQVVRRKY